MFDVTSKRLSFLLFTVISVVFLFCLYWFRFHQVDIWQELVEDVHRQKLAFANTQSAQWKATPWLTRQTPVSGFADSYQKEYDLSSLLNTPISFIQTMPDPLVMMMAKIGHADAQYLYANTFTGQQKKYWLEKAIELGSPQAKLAQAKNAEKAGDLQRAYHLVSTVNSAQAKLYQAKLKLKLGKDPKTVFTDELIALADFQAQFSQEYFSYQAHYHNNLQLLDEYLNSDSLEQHTKCDKPLYIFGQNIYQLNKAHETLKAVLTSHPEIFSSFCLPKIIWLTQGVKEQLKWHSEDYGYRIVINAHQPRAYVRGHSMYIDDTTSYNVIRHELAHWLGFEDEYSLSSHIANNVCQLNKGSFEVLGHNLVIVDSKLSFESLASGIEFIEAAFPWAAFIDNKSNWLAPVGKGKFKLFILNTDTQNDTSTIGLYQAKTCDRYPELQSIKPIYFPSFMFQHDNAIPDFYLELI
ncbi:hypothetical protein HR060_00470 [Catenovulum sp. SM1970]|uniref:hypothetical protein n=1 Tax=Marinifaba aquimaris TaxID=2741323 RepID=UPI0015716B14|nr:hypothetical protein [Marinifaba aquimaris]NTS75323.1 hypothetical protein [Marinifaba aquimaris]